MLDYGAGRGLSEIVAIFPVIFRTDWPGTETATAVRADISQNVFHAGTAERAFKRANHDVCRIRRQWLITIFTSGSQFEHKCLVLVQKVPTPCNPVHHVCDFSHSVMAGFGTPWHRSTAGQGWGLWRP